MSALQRRYARLMLAYPARFRREYGAELVTVLMDRAGPQRARPTAGEARDLVLGGLRQRLRLPVGRLVVLAAVCAALTFGALGAGLGSVSGWATAADLPSPAAVDRAVELAAGGPVPHDLNYQSTDSGLRRQMYSATPDLTTPWTLDEATARLEGAGWTVRRASAPPVGVEGIYAPGLIAERDGLVLEVDAAQVAGGPISLSVSLERAEPGLVLPLTLLGALAGGLAGWLLTARAGYRLRRLGAWPRASLSVLAILAGLTLAPVTLLCWLLLGYRIAMGGRGYNTDGRTLPGVSTVLTDQALSPFAAAGLGLAALALLGSYLVRPAAGDKVEAYLR